ncbi:MepB family protein [Mammaliicoccus sciuri]|uniref:MepB family protein n=1 Tax=Mammaliicoccus sciuri TaxID=1296 RepID=UPI002DBD83CA|nr:MepB family protein [Mammaliicoccus sciuri]MEB7066039.1 MepB family protein [Mammaliicoccus sciuri]
MFESTELIKSYFNDEPIEDYKLEKLNIKYEACSFQIQDITYRSRRAKKTANKKGYFVVFWVKDHNNQNRPYTYSETPEKLIIAILDNNKKRLFIFPKDILLKQKIISNHDVNGKMAMRFYPPWENHLNKTASQTQNWQKEFFIDLSNLSFIHS